MPGVRAFAKVAAKGVNAVLRPAGVQLVRHGARPFEEFRDYIPFKQTIAGAGAAGLSVGEYIDRKYNVPGSTGETIDRLKDAGILHPGVRRVCEIGPGSGRYLERTIQACKPEHYEIYETALEWREFLARTYAVIARSADGASLAATPTGSVDLVQAHKVFPGIPLLATVRYFGEMARVVAPGGGLVFDTVTEPCMTGELMDKWFTSGAGYQYYPSMMPRKYILEFFGQRGFALKLSFLVPMEPGKTECFAFVRGDA